MENMNHSRRFRWARGMAFVLAAACVFALLPVAALAEEEEPALEENAVIEETIETEEPAAEGGDKSSVTSEEEPAEEPVEEQSEQPAEESQIEEPSEVPVDAGGEDDNSGEPETHEEEIVNTNTFCEVDANGNRYYINPSTGKRYTGWLNRDGEWYYFPKTNNGIMATGLVKAGDGYTYYFDPASGAMHRGFITVDGYLYYMRPEDGTAQKGWRKIDGYWYYFYASNYTAATDWYYTGGYWYYFERETCHLHYGWFDSTNGYTYYMRPEDGTLQKGWRRIDGNWYYFDSSGHAASEWMKLGGYWYFFEKDTHALHYGWFKSTNGYTYYMRPEDGTLQTGWRKIDGHYYYFGSDGKMRVGWAIIGGYKYYFYAEDDGFGGIVGTNASDITVDGSYVNSAGYTTDYSWTILERMERTARYLSSPTEYLIVIDRDYCRMGVFRGEKGNWENIYYWSCGVGAYSTPTVTGIFQTESNGRYFYTSYTKGGICWYWTSFYQGTYCIHSILYYTSGGIMDGRLGMHLSHGCVRLPIDYAYWVYADCPLGTTVYVY